MGTESCIVNGMLGFIKRWFGPPTPEEMQRSREACDKWIAEVEEGQRKRVEKEDEEIRHKARIYAEEIKKALDK